MLCVGDSGLLRGSIVCGEQRLCSDTQLP
jgi:hypothetical protein